MVSVLVRKAILTITALLFAVVVVVGGGYWVQNQFPRWWAGHHLPNIAWDVFGRRVYSGPDPKKVSEQFASRVGIEAGGVDINGENFKLDVGSWPSLLGSCNSLKNGSARVAWHVELQDPNTKDSSGLPVKLYSVTADPITNRAVLHLPLPTVESVTITNDGKIGSKWNCGFLAYKAPKQDEVHKHLQDIACVTALSPAKDPSQEQAFSLQRQADAQASITTIATATGGSLEVAWDQPISQPPTPIGCLQGFQQRVKS